MRNCEYFKNKKIAVVGLARSGLACANLLHQLGAWIKVTDHQDDHFSRESAAKLISPQIQVELGKHSRELIAWADSVVISPGVPLDSPCASWALQLHKPLLSEIEVASILCPATIVAVTGSNGKTTVTTLIGQVLEASGRKVFVCGNIGTPFCGEVAKMKEDDFAVLEISSFQLETVRDFKPKVAVILNCTANHLDRYNNIREYLEAKERIFMNQDRQDYLVLSANDKLLAGSALKAKSQVVYFGCQADLNPNQSAVMAVGKILGLSPEVMLAVLNKFKGIPHRMEEVACIGGVKFINDSKATTADSAIWALNNIDAPIILIAGGRHKGIDYRVILDAARAKVRQAILIGEASQIIARDLAAGGFPIEQALTLKDALVRAYACAKPGDCILLSPMCSSYDMFKDFEERGAAFRQMVQDLAREQKVR